jgi:hypothetical protein
MLSYQIIYCVIVVSSMGDVNTMVITPTIYQKQKLKALEDEIVWPPTMIIENKKMAKNEDCCWIRIGNFEMV